MSSAPSTSTVCVVIAAYNAAATVGRAVESALAQPEAAEVIVVDDASTDDTAASAQSADDGSGRLRILQQSRNFGPSAARNRAIAESRSPWIAVLDADDFFLPGRLKSLLAYRDEADLIADDMWQVSEGNIDGPRRNLLGRSLPQPATISFAEFVLSNVTKQGRQRAELGFIKPLMRRAFIAAHAIHYREDMRLGEDFELYARALALGARLLVIPAQGYVSVVRPGSLSGLHSETDLLRLRDCTRQIAQDIRLNDIDKKSLAAHYRSVDCRLQWRLLILAVKNNDWKAALATFARPWPVPAYLVKQLALQVWIRSTKCP